MSGITETIAEAHRFFFALKPEYEAAARTYAWAKERVASRGLISPDRYHITLALTEDFPAPPPLLVEKLLAVGASVSGSPFSLLLDILNCSDRIAVLRPTTLPVALKQLQKRIRSTMSEQNVDVRKGWTFNPHQTLAYRKGEPFQCDLEGIHWEVDEFV